MQRAKETDYFFFKYLLQSCYSHDINATALNAAKERENTVGVVVGKKNKQKSSATCIAVNCMEFSPDVASEIR